MVRGLFVKQIVNINFRDIFYTIITKALYKLVQMMDRGYLRVKNQAFGANRPAFRSKIAPLSEQTNEPLRSGAGQTQWHKTTLGGRFDHNTLKRQM